MLVVLGATAGPVRAAPPAAAWADDANLRHAPLTQITPANVDRLTLAWRYRTGSARGHQGAPLVVGDTLYLVTPWPHRVVALDLATRRERWHYTPATDPQAAARLCCGPVNRGLAYAPAPTPGAREDPVHRALDRARASATSRPAPAAPRSAPLSAHSSAHHAADPATDPEPGPGASRASPGTLLMTTADARLLALDAATGRLRWQASLGDSATGVSSTAAPRVFGDVVIAGMAGGEYGARGHLDAHDLATGRRLWRGWSTGPDADLLIDPARTTTWREGAVRPVGADSSLQSWEGDAWQRGGGTTWGPISHDAERGLVIYGSGNPGTWNPHARPGDNRWTNALWARELRTGRVRWVFQMTPHDAWDYDGVNESLLFDGPPPGRRPLLAHFDRNGWVYVLDRATGALVRADRYDPAANWARAIDPRSGRPDVDPARSVQAVGEDTVVEGICPAAIGAKNQAPAAHDPARGLFLVPTIRLCMAMEAFAAEHTPGQPWTGASYTLQRAPGPDGRPAAPGALLAWDALQGRARWTVDEPLPLWSGVLSTASGLVFYGTLDGYLKAVDARDGRPLWTSRPLPSGVVGNASSWTWRGTQYVGVFAGTGGLAADPDGLGKLDTERRALPPAEGELWVFSLPDAR